MTDLVVLQRLTLITLLAGCIGYERERHGRAAGFRTHLLVGIGSCLVMMTGLYLMEASLGRIEVDPTRMASQVVSGIGFLGAGTILRERASIRGLTTAASLWAVAGIGLAVGAGFVSGSVGASAMVLGALFGLARLERAMRRDLYAVLVVQTRGASDDLVQIRGVLAAHGVEIRDFDLKPDERTHRVRAELHLKLTADQRQDEILNEVLRLEHTATAHWA